MIPYKCSPKEALINFWRRTDLPPRLLNIRVQARKNKRKRIEERWKKWKKIIFKKYKNDIKYIYI
jgi:hypothetical protein